MRFHAASASDSLDIFHQAIVRQSRLAAWVKTQYHEVVSHAAGDFLSAESEIDVEVEVAKRSDRSVHE